MEEAKKTTAFHRLGGILFAILTLWQLFGIVSYIKFFTDREAPLESIIIGQDRLFFWLIGLLIITISLFSRKRAILTVGFCILAFTAIQSCFRYFVTPSSNGLFILIVVIDLFGYLSAFLLSLTSVLKSDSKYTELGKKLFFVPSVCITISSLILILCQFNSTYRGIPVGFSWSSGVNRGGISFAPFFPGFVSVMKFEIRNVICIVALLFTSLWAVYPDVNKKKAPATRVNRIAMEPDAGGSNVYGNIQTNGSMEDANVSKKFCSYCGKEIMAQAIICPHCGCAVAASPEVDIPSTGLNVLSFFIPLVGLILYCVHQNKTPRKARAIGKWALIGFGVDMFVSILLYMVIFLLL